MSEQKAGSNQTQICGTWPQLRETQTLILESDKGAESDHLQKWCERPQFNTEETLTLPSQKETRGEETRNEDSLEDFLNSDFTFTEDQSIDEAVALFGNINTESEHTSTWCNKIQFKSVEAVPVILENALSSEPTLTGDAQKCPLNSDFSFEGESFEDVLNSALTFEENTSLEAIEVAGLLKSELADNCRDLGKLSDSDFQISSDDRDFKDQRTNLSNEKGASLQPYPCFQPEQCCSENHGEGEVESTMSCRKLQHSDLGHKRSDNINAEASQPFQFQSQAREFANSTTKDELDNHLETEISIKPIQS